MFRKRLRIIRKRSGQSNSYFILFVSALYLIILLSCGLERLVYLSPINKDAIEGKGTDYIFEFLHNLENDTDEFLGYEIFYKFYTPGSGTIAEDIISLEEKYVGTQNFMETRGFQRLQRLGSDGYPAPKPLIPISGSLKGTLLKIHMDFLSSAQPQNQDEPVLTVKRTQTDTIAEEFIIKRIQPAPNAELKKFIPEDFERNDPDIVKAGAGVQSLVDQRGTVAVSFCVLAYGRDANFSPIYSEVVFLIDRSRSEDVLLISLQ